MKKIYLFLLIFVFIFSTPFLIAQEDKREEVLPGMEIMEVGQTKILVPKDTKMRKKGGLIILENIGEYVARRILDVEERLAEVEAKEEELRREVEQFKKVLDEIQKSELTYKEKNE